MKTIVLFTLILLAFSAESQSLKDALYSGKLKADTGAVIRKGDTLKIKENIAQKVEDDSVKIAQKIIADSIKKETIALEKQNAIAAGKDTTAFINTDVVAETLPAEKTIPKDNNKIWKTFIDSVTASIKSEVITSGKLKKGAYSVLIEYEIKPDGQININSVVSDPQNSFLEGQIKVRLTLDAPPMNPVMGANGKPRTVIKKQLLNFIK
ncbi:MAG: hypothetical protein ACXWWC_05160 [Chitinophagaceae bacterium]